MLIWQEKVISAPYEEMKLLSKKVGNWIQMLAQINVSLVQII